MDKKLDYIIFYSHDYTCVPNILYTNKDYADKVWNEYKETGLIPHTDLSKKDYNTKIKPLDLYICKIENQSEVIK